MAFRLTGVAVAALLVLTGLVFWYAPPVCEADTPSLTLGNALFAGCHR